MLLHPGHHQGGILGAGRGGNTVDSLFHAGHPAACSRR
jgi:hypothetical protein